MWFRPSCVLVKSCNRDTFLVLDNLFLYSHHQVLPTIVGYHSKVFFSIRVASASCAESVTVTVVLELARGNGGGIGDDVCAVAVVALTV
jgi:hypothetical protein